MKYQEKDKKMDQKYNKKGSNRTNTQMENKKAQKWTKDGGNKWLKVCILILKE